MLYLFISKQLPSLQEHECISQHIYVNFAESYTQTKAKLFKCVEKHQFLPSCPRSRLKINSQLSMTYKVLFFFLFQFLFLSHFAFLLVSVSVMVFEGGGGKGVRGGGGGGG